MRAMLADPSARWRSMVGSILDRSGEVCFRLSARCFTLRERIAPAPSTLTPDASARILAGVMARIAQEQPSIHLPFHPTDNDRAAASLAQDMQQTVYFTATPTGLHVAVSGQRGRA